MRCSKPKKGLILLRILMPHPTFCLTLCKWFLQVRNWSIVRLRHFVLSTCCNVKPFTLNEIFPANVAILCRETITIKSVLRIFNVSLFELSQLKILLRSLLISVWRIHQSTAENVIALSMAMYVSAGLCMHIYGYVGLCMAMYVYAGLCRAMYRYVVLCMAM